MTIEPTVHVNVDHHVADAPICPYADLLDHGPFYGRYDLANVVCHGHAASVPHDHANLAEIVRIDRVSYAVANDDLSCVNHDFRVASDIY